MEVKHPLEEGLKGIYGVIFSDEPKGEDATLRNVTIFADGQVDRSPCGTGTSARIATLLEKMLYKREKFSSMNALLTEIRGEVLSVTAVDTYEAVVPKLTGMPLLQDFISSL